MQLAVKLVLEELDYGELRLAISRDGEGLYLDYVIYSGEERLFDVHQVSRAVWLFALSLNETGNLPEVELEHHDRQVQASAGTGSEGVKLVLSTVPGTTQELYCSNIVQLPSREG
ncbi:hypothetical protein [Paenibacillus sp. YN15]|uniref:hypothetical protein n=1 Tax=Paenibacillus sp. YN15 TaxID=1742774 RepID=UPI000DCE9640|nr:hypothetical protein [Paenibacillus sp. YN15]RAU93303.1 hypothetical protein DQG13_25910 [Paenibacillus sp. YN15]